MANPKIAVPKDFLVRLERTMCPGGCPDYSLIIYGDGTILYEGRRHVAEKGKRQGHIPINQIKMLLGEFDRIGFFWLNDCYDAIVNDGAITKTSIQVDGKFKQVINCHPSKAPEDLYYLEKTIDEISNSRRWVKRDGQLEFKP